MSRAKYQRERRLKHKEKGLCQHCNDLAFLGTSLCLRHMEANRHSRSLYRKNHRLDLMEKHKEERRRFKVEGKCIRCGAPLIEDEGGYCVACLAGRHYPIMRGNYETINKTATG